MLRGTPLRAIGCWGLAAIRTIEHSPHGKVLAQALQLMVGTGSHEYKIPRLHCVPIAAVQKNTTTSNYHV